MKHSTSLKITFTCFFMFISNTMFTMQNDGPMNTVRFYDLENDFAPANHFLQKQEWQKAEKNYENILKNNSVPEEDKYNANINMASCQMAQSRPSVGWASFDNLIKISHEKMLANVPLEKDLSNKTVLVRTDMVGIGDIFHFFAAVDIFKKQTQTQVTLSVKNFLIPALQSGADMLGISLIGEKDNQPQTDYETHLISLLGHCEIEPCRFSEYKKSFFKAPEEALLLVKNLIDPLINNGKKIVVVFLGENRQATLIGGKQLPRKPQNHGRHLNSEPFEMLLKEHPEIVLLDCGTKNGRITLSENQESLLLLPEEKKPFDTIIALAGLMNDYKRGTIIGFGADNGPTNVFCRALDNSTQDYMALIIPNDKEYDMRMEGHGSSYRQMISNARVYKCLSPKIEDQTNTVSQAYKEMIEQK